MIQLGGIMLQDQITKDYIAAMKARDTQKSAAINFLRAKIKDVQIEKRPDQLEEADVIAVIKKQVKQRQDSIEQYQQGGREDLATKEQAELAILKAYLPEEMSEEAVAEVVAQAISEVGATSMKEMGQVMKVVQTKTQGQADNKLVSQIVKAKLSEL